jgi:hypothetical protein
MPPSERTRAAHLQLLAVSWNFGWPIAAGVVLGYWIDGKLGSSPAATLLFGLGAMAASTWRLLALSRQEQAARRADELASPPPVQREDSAKSEPAEPFLAKPLRWDDETAQWVDDESAGEADWPSEGSGWDDDDPHGRTR